MSCGTQDIANWTNFEANPEHEADEFASELLLASAEMKGRFHPPNCAENCQTSSGPASRTSPSHDHWGTARSAGTSSSESWYRAMVVVVAQAK